MMNKTQKELEVRRDTLLTQLKECETELNTIDSEICRRAEIKHNYKPNYIEPKYERHWKDYAISLENLLLEISTWVDESLQKQIDTGIINARSTNSYQIPVDNSKVWNCPHCGESNCLYVGNWGDDFHPNYGVTCSSCGFSVPDEYKISDYGEAWCEFEEWLMKEGYIKEVE